jgi:hypothetical protein
MQIGPEPDGRRATAKLIITRPGNHRFWYALLVRRRLDYGVLLDGRRVATIGPGDTIGLTLSPGSHQVRAKFGIFGSQSIEIDAASDERLQLVARLGVRWQTLNIFAAIVVLLSTLPFFWSVAWVSFHGLEGILAADVNWLGVFLLANVSLSILALLFQIIVPVVSRNNAIELIKLPRLDSTELPLSDILRPRSFPARIKVGHVMIAVAILAVVIATSASFTRHERSNYFRRKADAHAREEAMIRESEREFLSIAVDFEKAGIKNGPLHETVAKTRAAADFHAVMRHKYEQAASQGRFYVEADPPPPIWP